ncbi:RE1, partial [Symbiodinium sp. CCMP2456]
YEEEALLWQEGIAYHKRYMAGPRLVAELQGSAKRMVVGKSANWVSYAGGVEVLMRHLRDCLGRPQVTELTEYLNQYFRHSRRRNGESINEYVTRKSEIYMRAQQALNRVKPHQEVAASRVSREAGYSVRRRSSWTSDATTTAVDGDDDDAEASTENTQSATWDSQGSYGGWGGAGGYWSGNSYPAWWSTSSWSWADSRGYGEPGASQGAWASITAGSTELLPEWVQAWYLLQDANLSTSERNMIFTALKGEFSVVRVAQELRNQWTETDLKKRDQHYKGSGFLGETGEDEDFEIQEAWQTGEMGEHDGDLNDEGAALVAEAEDDARQAWAVLQNAKRTLKDARQRQHQVRMSRKYYQPGGSGAQASSRPRDDSKMTCLKCGQVGHRAANCQQEKAHAAEDQSAPFVCYVDQAMLGDQGNSGRAPTTSEATQAGWGVIDGGATRTLGSVQAIEALMRANEGKRGTTGVKNVDLRNRPVFGFADSGEAKCVSTIDMGLHAGGNEGMLRVHALNKGSGPILVSVATLRALGAIIDFEEDILVLRKLDPTKLIRLQRSTTGHQLVNLTDDLFQEATTAKQESSPPRATQHYMRSSAVIQVDIVTILPARSFLMPAMDKMNTKQLRDAIQTFGEIPAESWNNSQLRHRLQELMDEQDEEWASTPGRRKDTPLQQQIKQLNRNKRKKADLQEYVSKVLGLPVSENETMWQLETKALDHLYFNVESCSRDVVGFGRHSNLTYGELVQQFPRYVDWVKTTHKETEETNPRLKRLAEWLLRATEVSEPIQRPLTTRDPQRLRLKIKGGYVVEPEYEPPQTTMAASSTGTPYPAEQTELMATMMETMKGMQEELKELRQMGPVTDERPRKKVRHLEQQAQSLVPGLMQQLLADDGLGGDLSTSEGLRFVMDRIRLERPQNVWINLPGGWWNNWIFRVAVVRITNMAGAKEFSYSTLIQECDGSSGLPESFGSGEVCTCGEGNPGSKEEEIPEQGMYAQGEKQQVEELAEIGRNYGITNKTMEFPQVTAYINQWLARNLPKGAKWTSFVLSTNNKMPIHRDNHNDSQHHNYVIGVGQYKGGEVWVETPPGYTGPDACAQEALDGTVLQGRKLPTQGQCVNFSPKAWHGTCEWTGDRFTVAAYVSRGGHWVHPQTHEKLQFMVIVDECSRFRAARSQHVESFCDRHQILLDIIPGEAHWKLGICEQGVSSEEALAVAVMTFNHRDVVRGFSPVQHALGHNPDQVGEVERAAQLRAAAEGELVYLWRAQTGQQGRRQPGDKHGQFIGPARILATEKKKDETGHLVPGSSVWLVRGRSLIKCCPEQLRRASEREELLEMLAKPEDRTPWTFQRVAAEIGGNQVKDYSQQQPTSQEWHGAQDTEETAPPTRMRFRGKRPQPEAVEPTIEEEDQGTSSPSASSSRARLGNQPGSGFQAAEAWWASVPEKDWEDQPAAYWNDESAAVSVEIELPTNVRGLQKTLHHLPAYFVGAMKRRAVEVCERKLTPSQKEEFRAAKNIEVRNFIASKAFETLPDELRPSREQAINMRWILTWKATDSGGQKAKARAVLLGYQDPKYEFRSTTAPVMTRQTRQMQLQLSANRNWTVQKGDVSGAFLQGREYPDQLYCIPCKEICEAMGVPEGTITRLKRACYGLVDAPLEWYRTVDEYLCELGLERTYADACAWVWRPKGELRGMISGHVDDFLFSGSADDAEWQALLEKIRQRFKWGDWEQDKFVQCGVQVERTPEGFQLSQPNYLEGIKEIPLSSSRRKEKDAPTGEREKTQLRALLGGLSWHAQQVAPHLSAEVSLLLSEISESNVNTIIKANLLAYHAKARQDHRMLIHQFSSEETMVLFGWVDAASQNRREGGSTQGIFIGMGSAGMLHGELGRVTPIAWHSNKIDRACRSPGAAEAQAAVNGEDALYFARYQWSELCFGSINLRHPDETVAKVTGCLVTDSRNVYDKLSTEVLVIKGAEKRTNIELLAIKEAQRNHGVLIRWVHSEAQLANALTKHGSKEMELYYRMRHSWRIVEDPEMMSARRNRGMQVKSPGCSITDATPPRLLQLTASIRLSHGLDVLTGKAIGTELKNADESKVNMTMERVVELLKALSSEANRFDYDSWLVLVRDNNDYMEELAQEFKEQKHEIRKMLMINSIEASEFLNSRLLIAATNFTKWFEKMRKLADEFEDFVAKQRMMRGAPDRMLARDRFLLHSRLRKETSTRMHEIREALKKQATSNHNRRLDAQVELRLSDRQDMETDESAAFEHHKRSRKRKTTGDVSTARRSSLASKRSSHMEEQIFNYIQNARHYLDEVSLLVQEKNEKEGRAKDMLLKLHFKQLAMERKKLRAAAKEGSSTFGSSAFESVMPGRSAALYAHKKRHQHEDFNVSSHLLQQVAICRELNALTVNVELNHIWTGVEGQYLMKANSPKPKVKKQVQPPPEETKKEAVAATPQTPGELFKQKGRQTAIATSTILAMQAIQAEHEAELRKQVEDQRAKERQRALELEQQRAAEEAAAAAQEAEELEEDDDELMNFPPNFSVVDVQLLLSDAAVRRTERLRDLRNVLQGLVSALQEKFGAESWVFSGPELKAHSNLNPWGFLVPEMEKEMKSLGESGRWFLSRNDAGVLQDMLRSMRSVRSQMKIEGGRRKSQAIQSEEAWQFISEDSIKELLERLLEFRKNLQVRKQNAAKLDIRAELTQELAQLHPQLRSGYGLVQKMPFEGKEKKDLEASVEDAAEMLQADQGVSEKYQEEFCGG